MGKEATAKVTPFPQEEPEAKPAAPIPAPAIGASILINIGGDRQLTLQGFFERDASDDECNRVLDKLCRLATRQKAFSDVLRLNDELDDHRKALTRFNEDLARADAATAEKLAAKEAEIKALNVKATEIHDAAYARFAGQGKSGVFKPRGGDEAGINRIKADIGKVATEIAKIENEQAQYIDQLKKNQERYHEEIALREKRLAEAQALIGG